MSRTELLLLLALASSFVLALLLRRRAAHAQRDLRTIFETAPIPTLVLDAGDRIAEANAAVVRIAGREPRELGGRALAQLVHPDDRALLRVGLAQLRHDVTGELVTEVRILPTADSPAATAALHATHLQQGRGRGRHLLVQLLDITERKRTEVELRRLADHDPLTGLLNRRRFEQELARHLAHVRRYGPEGAALVLDLDGFKPVNDTFGHAAGDRLLARVAHVLRERLRATDVIARLGGDEFAILLPRADRDAAATVARHLVETVRAEALTADAESVTVSVGVMPFDADAARSPEAVLASADLAMYEAKSAGGDGFVLLSEPELRCSRGSRAAA